ncbi:MAG: T9SS type A sorting domain-containing protein [Bacteroidetes bacterium]|nr:T9SS type A sorting domain-containing protein [Bacteroidota bacterium]
MSLTEKNYTAKQAMLNLIPATRNLEGNALAGYNDYKTMMQMQMAWQQQRSIFDLDSLEVANLIFIAENSQGTAGLQAKGILEYAYGHHFCNCLNINDMSGLKRSGSINPDDLAKLHGVEVNAHPNPASQWVAFNYTLPANTYQGEIKIVDAKGAVITSFTVTGTQGQQVWDSRSVTPGVYFYTLSVGEFTKSGKIVINK